MGSTAGSAMEARAQFAKRDAARQATGDAALAITLALNAQITTLHPAWPANPHSRLTLITNASLASILAGLAQIAARTTAKLAKHLILCMLRMASAFSVMILIVISVLAPIRRFATSAPMASLSKPAPADFAQRTVTTVTKAEFAMTVMMGMDLLGTNARCAEVGAKIVHMTKPSARCAMMGCFPIPTESAGSVPVTVKPATRIKTASSKRKGRPSMVLWWWIVGLVVAHATPLPHSFVHPARSITSCKEATATNAQTVASSAQTH